jgi:hypothetical protein
MAGAYRFSRLGRAKLSGARSALGRPTPSQRALINQVFRGLGDYYSTGINGEPIFYDSSTGAVVPLGPSSGGGGVASVPSAYGTSAIPGSISPQDAALLSTAITAAGKVGTQAIIGTPTLTYNPETGTYTATGGATVPTSLGLTTAITSYLPLILLGGGAILLVSLMGRK